MRGVGIFIALLWGIAAAQGAASRPISGALFIHGGGPLPPPLLDQFLGLCDRPAAKLVIIPTAAADAQIDVRRIIDHWSGRGFAQVDVLHTRSREEADMPAFVAPLHEAGAVWIGGGLQARLEAAYVGTLVEGALRSLIDRGGVVGGTSAGAAVMSRVMIRSGQPVAEVGTGFGLIDGAVIDQHFVARGREPRLHKVLEDHPGLVGYGVDEGTALILRGRRLSVVGASTVGVCLPASACGARPANTDSLEPSGVADHIALHRAALARAEGIEFPRRPATFPQGTVIAFGGGGTTKGGLERFVERAGGQGARIAVIYTALADDPRMPKHWRRLWDSVGAKNIRLLHARDRAQANSSEFVAEIDAAGGIWFMGGRQWRLVDRYLGTQSEAAIRRVLGRGGVVGGTSAGATILGDYLVRGDPLTSETMMQEGYEQGLALLPGVAIDQHFSQRGRSGDMRSLKRKFPQLLGIGIDEGAAVAFEGGGCEVFGRGRAFLFLPSGDQVVLGHGDQFQLAP